MQCGIQYNATVTSGPVWHCFGCAVYREEGNKLQTLGQHASDRKQDFVCLGKKHSIQWESKYGRNRKSQTNKEEFEKVKETKHQT